MAKGRKICKVCGEEYEYCHTQRPRGVFRYQDVACCPEHGSIYLQRVMEARGLVAKEPAEVEFEEEKVTPEVVLDYVEIEDDDDSDGELDEDFDDEDNEEDF